MASTQSNHRFGIMTRRLLLPVVAAVVFLYGCAGKEVKDDGANPPPSVDQTAEKTLALASTYYDAGNYTAVIGLLTANRDWLQASAPLQIRARKLLAFSHCVNGQTTVCEWYFDAILGLDPGFELAPFEVGHPAWDPAFRRAKKAFEKRKGG